MVTSEVKKGKTPNGGVQSVIYYKDQVGNPVDKSKATQCEIVEFDANGRSIFNTYGYCNGWTPDQVKDAEID